MTTLPIFTLRNTQGQYLGAYRAKTAAIAIARFWRDDAQTAATFRKSQPALATFTIIATEGAARPKEN